MKLFASICAGTVMAAGLPPRPDARNEGHVPARRSLSEASMALLKTPRDTDTAAITSGT